MAAYSASFLERVFFFFGGSTTGSLPFLLSQPMTRWIERRDEPTDGVAMDGGDGAEQWRLWCSGGASRGEARQCELRWWRCGCVVVAVARLRAARLRGRGGGATTGGSAAARQRHDGSAGGQRRGRTMAWWRRRRTTAQWRRGRKTNRKENLTVAALYRLEPRLTRCGGKRTSVQI
jgi:hypothetical protein